MIEKSKTPSILKYSTLVSSAFVPATQAAVTVFTPNFSYNELTEQIYVDIEAGIAMTFSTSVGSPTGADIEFENQEAQSVNGDAKIAYTIQGSMGKIGQAFVGSNTVDGTLNFGNNVNLTLNGQPNGEVIIGFEFVPDSEVDLAFGWAKLTGVGSGTATLAEVGWESEPGVGVHIIPEASTGLLMLAGGSLGAFRRRRKSA